MRSSIIAALAAASLWGCSGQSTPAPEPSPQPWQFEDASAELRAASCPDGVPFARADDLPIIATPVDLGEGLDPQTHLPGATFVGGWHLNSDNPALGGLSGLDLFPSGNLLTVTDEGAFVWINVGDDGAPASAHLAEMLGSDGQVIGAKREKDAEGLALQDGLALVSLERDHRILAFDLEGCGVNARGADVAQLGDRISGMARDMDSNGGAEGLALEAPTGELLIGIETLDVGAPIAKLADNRVAGILFHIADGQAPRITGLDTLNDQLFVLRREYEAGYGNTILVQRAQDGYTETLVHLDPTVTVDNFEGIAAVETPEGVRLWIVSDNNFSPNQRTLLFAFDVKL